MPAELQPMLQSWLQGWPQIHNQLHFLRPDWFYAFIPLALYLLLAVFSKGSARGWSQLVDARLRPFVLTHGSSQGGGQRRRRWPLLLVLLGAALAITALAGPVYKKLPQPVYREQSALVILLDLSRSMDATDVRPSRLARARMELLDILQQRKSGQSALIVYAADAFVVTPLTDDNATIANLVPALETSMMPAQGSNLTRALQKAWQLLNQGGVVRGDILVITDDIHARDLGAIEKIAAQGHRVSVFGIGTAQGAPIPLADGGFLTDADGAIVVPRLDAARLQRYALAGGGLYTSLAADDSDIDRLLQLFDAGRAENPNLEQQETENSQQADTKADTKADIWREEGHWLLLPLLLIAALWARRGWLAVALIFLLPLPPPAMADSDSSAPPAETAEPSLLQRLGSRLSDTDHLWLSPDQKAMRAFRQGDMDTAAGEFTRPEWKASALYRKGDYAHAAKVLEGIDSTDAWYNRGNALARAGRLQQAVEAYDRALALDPGNEDARANREIVKQALQQLQQQQNSQQQGESQQNESPQEQQQGQQQDGQQQDDKQQDGQQNGQQQGDQQQNDQENAGESQNDSAQDQNDPQQQQAKDEARDEASEEALDESLKQRNAEQEAKQQQQEMEQFRQQQAEQEQEQSSEQQASEEQHSDDSQNEEPQNIENREADDNEKPAEIEVNPVERSISEEEKATEQWLKRIPDDPGGLLRRKFYYQYQRVPGQRDDEQSW